MVDAIAHHTPEPVPAHLGGAAVCIPVLHPKGSTGRASTHRQQTIRPDPGAPIADRSNVGRFGIDRTVDEYEVVRQPVHLHECGHGRHRSRQYVTAASKSMSGGSQMILGSRPNQVRCLLASFTVFALIASTPSPNEARPSITSSSSA